MKTLAACLVALSFSAAPASAAVLSVVVDGTDAIFLAGRSDLVVPPANQPWADNNPATDDGLRRHAGPTPEETLETFPELIAVGAGDVIRVLDPAQGGVNFFNGSQGGFFGPEGNGAPGASNLTSLGGISGYTGPQGALVGVFLDGAIPNGAPPAAIVTDLAAISITPELGQIFYIGDGQATGGDFRQFIAPTDATRLFIGIADGFSFTGVPGAYDDNDGQYTVRVGINEIPEGEIPLPGAPVLFLSGLAAFALRRVAIRRP